MTPEQQRKIRGMRYRIGGRGPNSIDCLGVVLHVLHLRGCDALDPWKWLLQSFKVGQVASESAFGPGWQRVFNEPLCDLDVLLYHESHSWAAIVDEGIVWSAHPDVGVWCKPVQRLEKRPHEVWQRKVQEC